MSSNTLNEQVRAYQANPTTEARNAIVVSMMPFLKSQARRCARKFPRMDEGDAVAAAALAVMEAVERYDGSINFEGYAQSRVQGCITEEGMRSQSHMTIHQQRYVKQKNRTSPFFGTYHVEADDGSSVNVVDLEADRVSRVSMPEAAEQFSRFMTSVTPAQNQVMQLHYTKDRTVHEIASEVGWSPAEVIRLLEDAHRAIRDEMLTEAEVAEVVDMFKIPDELLEYGKLAYSQAPLQKKKPEDVLRETLRRASDVRVSLENMAIRIVLDEAAKDLKRHTPSFTPVHQVNRQPPRGLASINAASVARISSMFDTWKMSDGRKLGDIRGDELQRYIELEVQSIAKHTGRATFYTVLAKRVPPDKTVRESVDENVAHRMYAQTCKRVHLEFGPKGNTTGVV